MSLTFVYYAFAVKERSRLKSKYKECVQAATRYAKTIDDFDNLVNPRTLARHFLGLEPSPFVLRPIEIEEKSEFCLSFFHFLFYVEMTTKFNQEMYAKMKAKKNEPLSSLGKKVVRVVEKGVSVTLTVSIPEAKRTASPTTSLEELTPRSKRQRTMAKGKEKMGSQASNV